MATPVLHFSNRFALKTHFSPIVKHVDAIFALRESREKRQGGGVEKWVRVFGNEQAWQAFTFRICGSAGQLLSMRGLPVIDADSATAIRPSNRT